MKTIVASLISFAVLLVTGCDEGRLYDEPSEEIRSGMSAHICVELRGAEQWGEGYTLALAGFKDGSEYAIISKNITPDESGKCDMVMDGIPIETDRVAICTIDRLRRCVATFVERECQGMTDTIKIEKEVINVSPAYAIQKEIFNTTCINCHGGSNYAAAGLSLMEGSSFESMVNVNSVKIPGKKRISPGESENSVLWMILSTDISSSWNYDHSVEVVNQEKLDLIKNWIETGARY